MEIQWKMQWTCCLLMIISIYLTTLTSSTPIPDTTTELTPENKTNEQKDVDLDLETQDQVAILKQINRVNEDGSYTFGYEAADGSFKIETRDVNGNVKGMFGFINEDGELKRVSYSASNGTGFQTTGAFNVPPLPGSGLSSEEELDNPYRSVPPQLAKQKLYPQVQDASTRIQLLPPSTTSYDTVRTTELIPTPRLPIYIFSTTPTNNDFTTTVRPVVIQHIPKIRPTPATSTTETTESGEVEKKKTFASLLPKKTSNTNYVTLKTNDVTTEATDDEDTTKKPSVIQVIRPRTGPLKKVIVTKRPVVETTTLPATETPTPTPKTITTTEFYSNEYLQRLKDSSQGPGNALRRQLGLDNNYGTTPENLNLVTSGTEDSPDVYGGSPTPRPYTSVAYRTLFTQIPQHQRILQNSYIQNQNQYLAAAFSPGVTPRINPQIPPTPQDPARLLPAPPVLPDNVGPNNFNSRPDVQGSNEDQRRPLPVPPQTLTRVFPNQIPVQPGYPSPLQPSPYDNGPYNPYNPQLYLPPGLLENLIRTLLSMRAYQQMISPDPSLATPDQRFGLYPQNPVPISHPYPNYSQAPYQLPLHYIPRTNYDPRLTPYPGPYGPAPAPYYIDPRVNNYQPTNLFRPLFYGPYQGRAPFQQSQDPLLIRTLFNGRPIPNVPNAYSPQVPDSTTSSTTSTPRIGSVRNVQILNPNNEDSEESEKFERDVKS